MRAVRLKVKLAIGQSNIVKGFTLLEVMVALVVIALTLSAFIKVSTLQSKHLMMLQDKMVALWVSEDVTHELQSGIMTHSVNVSELSGERTVFHKTFEWQIQFEPVEDSQIIHSEITVNLKGSSSILSRYDSYFSQPESNETAPTQ